MHLPTGRYRVLLLWARFANPNSKHWQIDFVLTDTGERGSAFVFKSDMGRIGAAGDMQISNGMMQPRDPDALRHVLALDLKYNKRFGNTRATGAIRTDEKMQCDIRFYGSHFEVQDF